MDIVRLDVPLFIRLLELAREDVKDDRDLHDVAEIVTKLSSNKVVSMEDYPKILEYMKEVDPTDELSRIKELGGITKNDTNSN